jgi:hypothetical protein
MHFADFSPPATPSLDQQRDALKKGLGRAMQWAMRRVLDVEPLLAACLQDGRYDAQIEETRGEWLWKMIRAVNAVDCFRVPILHALYELSDDRSANQLCELARFFAESGDETFRKRLYEIVEQKPIAEDRWLGEEEIIRLDGEAAFLFAARVRGKQLLGRDWEWDDGSLVTYAIERCGEERVNDLLEHSTDSDVRLFRGVWLHQKIADDGQQELQAYRDRMRKITVDDIIAAAESDRDGSYSFRGWGMQADQTQLESVLQHLWNTQDVNVIANLLKVFSKRPLPTFDSRLTDLCQHVDSEVRRRAFNALQNNRQDLIRAYALSQLQKGLRDGFVISLFARNFQQGDEQQILSAIELPDDDDECHWLLMGACNILENNSDANAAQLGIIGYASTPCGFCREEFVQALLRQNAAPGWLIEECRFDAFTRIVESISGLIGTNQ